MMKEKTLAAGSAPEMILGPTQAITTARPAAAITSMSGEEKARTRKLRRWMRSHFRLASSKRPDSQRSMPKAWTTRMPLTVSCTISEIWPMEACPCTVAFLSRWPSRITGSSVMGMAPKTTSDICQSRKKQLASITTTVRPSRR